MNVNETRNGRLFLGKLFLLCQYLTCVITPIGKRGTVHLF